MTKANFLSENLSELKEFMNNPAIQFRTVSIWNRLREEAKEKFTQQTISKLDASAYITDWMKGN